MFLINFLINSKTKTNWKFIAIVAVLGVLVGGGILWYTNSQIPESPSVQLNIPHETLTDKKEVLDTSQWNTYRNEQIGIEVKYPENFYTLDVYEGLMVAISNVKLPEDWAAAQAGIGRDIIYFGAKNGILVTITKESSKGKVFIEDWLKDRFPVNKLSPWDFTKFQSTTVNGYKGAFNREEFLNECLSAIIGDCDAGKASRGDFISYLVYILKNGEVFSISGDVKKDKTYDAIFNQILSTFRFTEPTTPSIPSQEDLMIVTQEEPREQSADIQKPQKEPLVPTTKERNRFLVKSYLVYPLDKPMYPAYREAIEKYMEELSMWYEKQIGRSFFRTPLQVVRHPFRNYLEMRCGENPRQECVNNPSLLEGNWAQYMNEAIHGGTAAYHDGGPAWATDTVYLVFGVGGGGYAGANSKGNTGGWAVVGDWVLEPVSGVSNEWGIPCSYSDGWQCSGGVPKGTPAHELGHAFGLPHPGEEYRDKTIMEWHGNFPEVGFLPQEIDFLRNSPFFN